MDLSPQTLWRLSGEALALCYRGAAGYEARLTPHASMVLSGEQVADLNYALIDVGADLESRLREFISVAKLRKLPLLVLFSPDAARCLKPAAQELGMQFAEYFPFMSCQPSEATFKESPFEFKRVENIQDLQASNRVVADAINVSYEVVNRAFGPLMLEGAGVDLFVAEQAGQTVSTVQTTRAGSTVGIWAMATSPNHQRKGAAKALLDHVMAYHCQRGDGTFYLGATPPGKPLYEKVGFKTVAVAEVWLLP